MDSFVMNFMVSFLIFTWSGIDLWLYKRGYGSFYISLGWPYTKKPTKGEHIKLLVNAMIGFLIAAYFFLIGAGFLESKVFENLLNII